MSKIVDGSLGKRKIVNEYVELFLWMISQTERS